MFVIGGVAPVPPANTKYLPLKKAPAESWTAGTRLPSGFAVPEVGSMLKTPEVDTLAAFSPPRLTS